MGRKKTFEKEEILNKAMNLFWEKGFYDTSAQDMVEKLGLNRSSLYHSFTDKKQIFTESLNCYISNRSASLQSYINTSSPEPENIRKLFELIVDESLSDASPKGCFVVNSAIELGSTDSDIRQIIQQNINDVINAFTVFFEKAQIKGTIKKDKNPKELAVAIFHSMTAIRVTSKVISDKNFHTQHIDTIMQLFT